MDIRGGCTDDSTRTSVMLRISKRISARTVQPECGYPSSIIRVYSRCAVGTAKNYVSIVIPHFIVSFNDTPNRIGQFILILTRSN